MDYERVVVLDGGTVVEVGAVRELKWMVGEEGEVVLG